MAPMTCDAFAHVLGDLLECDANEAVRTTADAHAAECVACALLLTDLRRLRADAARLGTIEPMRDLWSGIAERLDTPVIAIGDRTDESRRIAGRRDDARVGAAGRRLSWPVAAIAAAGLVLATAGVTTLVVRRSMGAAGVDRSPDASTSVLASQPALAPIASEEVYGRQITALRETIAKRRASIDPVTIAIVERNLSVIDSAIVDCREALARDPSSQFLVESLSSAYESKIALLRTVATLPAAE